MNLQNNKGKFLSVWQQVCAAVYIIVPKSELNYYIDILHCYYKGGENVALVKTA